MAEEDAQHPRDCVERGSKESRQRLPALATTRVSTGHAHRDGNRRQGRVAKALDDLRRKGGDGAIADLETGRNRVSMDSREVRAGLQNRRTLEGRAMSAVYTVTSLERKQDSLDARAHDHE